MAKILYNLAGRKELLGDSSGALEFYQRALATFERLAGPSGSEEVADALDAIAELKWQSGEGSEAMSLYQRALEKYIHGVFSLAWFHMISLIDRCGHSDVPPQWKTHDSGTRCN